MYGFKTCANVFDLVVYGRIVSAPTKPYGLYTHLSLRGATRAVILEQSEESRAATRQSKKIGVSYEIATLTLAMTPKGCSVATEGCFVGAE